MAATVLVNAGFERVITDMHFLTLHCMFDVTFNPHEIHNITRMFSFFAFPASYLEPDVALTKLASYE